MGNLKTVTGTETMSGQIEPGAKNGRAKESCFSENQIQKLFARFPSPEPTFSPAQAGDPPQIFIIFDLNVMSSTRGFTDSDSFCEPLKYYFLDGETR